MSHAIVGGALAALAAACSLVTSLDGYVGGDSTDGGPLFDPAEGGAVEATKQPDAGAAVEAGDTCDGGGIVRGGVCIAKPVALWAFDEGSGSVANDSSGNGLTGTISGATWVAGRVGPHALAFDGVSSMVDFGRPSQLAFGTVSFSYTALVYVNAQVGQYDVPFWKGGSSANEPGYDMELGTGPWEVSLSDGVTSPTGSFGAGILGSWYAWSS